MKIKDFKDLDKILNKYYDKIEIINEIDIVRCEKHYKSIPYQIYYYDYSQKWLEENFDLEKYLEKLLTSSYYSNPGSLQWNFYIVFLHNSKVVPEEKKVIIEKNEEFARKFVLNYELLDDWLGKKYKIVTDKSSAIGQDLSLLWMNKLKENDLDCIYSDISYAKGLKSFIEGNPFKEPDELDNPNQSVIKHEKITAIKKIFLDKFRKYPIKKEFDFGKVNLIFGQNGSGKTSLFEAIEVFLCGKSFRNPDYIDTSTSIRVLYDNKHNSENIDILNTKKYKSRDAYWYNNPKQKMNELYIGFNRFNFYNSDAAFSFSNQGPSDELQKAFEDIALGEKVNYIEQRLDGYSERFEKELRKYNSFIGEYKEIITRENNTLNEIIKVNKNPEFLFNEFIDEAKNIGWKGSLPISINDSYAIFEKDFNKIKHYLDKVLENINWLENLTINSLLTEKNKVDKLKINIQNRYKNINEENNKLTEHKERLNYLNEILATLNKLKIYISTGASIKLIGLDKKIKNLTLKELNYKEAIQITEDADLSLFKDSRDIPEEFRNKLEKELREKLTKKSVLNKRINKLEKGLSQLEDIIIQIKSKGREFLEITPKAQNCPLCNAYYDKDELKFLIKSSYKNIEDSEVTKDLIIQLDELNKEIENLSIQLNTLNSMLKVFSKIEIIDYCSKYTLSTISEKIGHAREEYFKIQQELRTLDILKDDLNSKGFSEKEFIELKEKLAEKGIKFDENEPNYSIRNLLKYEKESEDIKNNINDANNIIIQENKLIKVNLVNNFNEKISPNDFDSFLHNRIEKINSSIKILEDLSDVITISADASINNIKIIVESIYKLFEKFKEEKIVKDEKDLIIRKSETTINLYETKIANVKKNKERTEKAYSTIKEILTNNSKKKYLQDFLDINKKEIVRIFNAIHSPKEFDDIDFTNSRITLKRINSTGPAKLSEISTGQRSALALSVFLCLNNKLKNGPPYLIFDDPISFVDDLNLLSFIDYLREVAINTDKQIFFATANENLEFLFSQKLKFLGDEFITHKLIR